MSQENVEVVRSAFDAFEKGEVSEMLDWMTDDLTTHRVEPDDAIYHGKEGFFQATADWIEDFDDWTVRPEAFLDAGDSVVVRVRQAARGERSGVPVEGLAWFGFGVRGGKIAHLSIHLREAEALEAAGLSEDRISQRRSG
jgi:ketosteroid isomerase-like protein